MRFCAVSIALMCAVVVGITSATAQSFSPLWTLPGIRAGFVLLTPADSSVLLPDRYVIPHTVKISRDSLFAETGLESFGVEIKNNHLILSPEFRSRIREGGETLYVSYRYLALQFRDEYYLRTLTVRLDSSGIQRRRAEPATSSSGGDIFGERIRRSGSIVRGFTLGTNRDVSVTSGFRLSMSGKLSDEIDVVAVLTDENTPIQPEGNTQTLRELDKVFIEIKSPQYGATLGDFNFELPKERAGEFLTVTRKLQGAQGTASYRFGGQSAWSGSSIAAGAVARGTYHSNSFLGIEGNQGPYRLTGKSGETRILVIAGSERVYFNGEQLMRGENNDYVIDYANGEVTFTPKRLITSVSRLTIDFEYAERRYSRSFVGAASGIESRGGTNRLNVVFFQEADDPDAPVDVAFDDSARALLKNAGKNPYAASLPGELLVGTDSITGLGKGQYVVRDTLMNGRAYRIFVYAPGDPAALYSVTFSPVDAMPPDSAGYVRVAAGQFQFAGIGLGTHLPLVFLPLPKALRTVGVNGTASPVRGLELQGNLSFSSFNENRFAASNTDVVRNGTAYSYRLKYSADDLRVGDIGFGSASLGFAERYVGSSFISPDRLNEVEYDRRWNSQNAPAGDERTRDLRGEYSPVKAVSIAGELGRMSRAGSFISDRMAGNLRIADSTLPSLRYGIESMKARESRRGTSDDWFRQDFYSNFRNELLIPSVSVQNERRNIFPTQTDSIASGSFQFTEIVPRLELSEVSGATAFVEYGYRTEDSAASGSLSRAFTAVTQKYGVTYRGAGSLSSSLLLSVREVQFEEEYKQRGNVNSDILLGRLQSRYAPFRRGIESDLFYEFSTQRSARLERIFVRVQRGTGSYKYVGDTNGNGIADENEFEPVRFDGDYSPITIAGDKLYPVVDLKTSFRVRITPVRLLGTPASGMEKVLSALSSETFVRVEEKSSESDTKKIYLLDLSRFLSAATTLAGTQQLTQDIHVFESSPELSFRLRANERRGLVQYLSWHEWNRFSERGIRMRSQPVGEIGNQTEIFQKIDKLTSDQPIGRTHNVLTDGVSTDFSYRPAREWEVGFVIDAVSALERSRVPNPSATINSQSLRLVYSVPSRGQFRVQVQREDVTTRNLSHNEPSSFAYEVTSGKTIGKNYLWQVSADYRVGENVQFTLTYLGRSEGGRPAVHIGQAEARAFF